MLLKKICPGSLVATGIFFLCPLAPHDCGGYWDHQNHGSSSFLSTAHIPWLAVICDWFDPLSGSLVWTPLSIYLPVKPRKLERRGIGCFLLFHTLKWLWPNLFFFPRTTTKKACLLKLNKTKYKCKSLNDLNESLWIKSLNSTIFCKKMI